VVDLDLTITDKSFVNLLLGMGGMFRRPGDPATLRSDIVNMLKRHGPGTCRKRALDPAVANELLNAVSEFVKAAPASLNIKLKAGPEPVALGRAPM